MAANTDNYFIRVNLDLRNTRQLNNLIKDIERLRDGAAKDPLKPLRQSAKKTQIQMRQTGRGLQNASYQIQDMIVQIGGGVDPLRSMSQQLPQLMINMGALGAMVGVIAAGLPLVIQYLKGADAVVMSLSDSMGELSTRLDTATGTTQSLDLSKWVDQWNQADEAVRRTMLSVLEFDVEMARRAFEDSLETAAGDAGDAAGITFADRFISGLKAVRAELEDAIGLDRSETILPAEAAANRLGISQESLLTLRQITKDFDDAKISVDEYTASMQQLIVANPQAGKTLKELETATRQLVEERNKLAEAEAKLSEARKGGTLTGGTEDKKAAAKLPRLNRVVAQNPYEDTFKRAEANLKLAESYELLYDPLFAYEQELQKIADIQNLLTPETTAKAVEAAAKRYEEATEQITFAAQAAEVFENSFNTAFDGVAQGTQDVSDAFRNMAKVIIAQLLKIAAYKTIAGFWPGGTFAGQTPFAQGGVVQGGNVSAFAKGGVVSGPTVFPMANGMGLMGEAGPEAVMPLKRMGNGNLGVESSGMNVVVNNMAPGVQAVPRQSADGLTIDVVLQQAAQAVQSGGNVFADSLEKSYSLNRGRATY